MNEFTAINNTAIHTYTLMFITGASSEWAMNRRPASDSYDLQTTITIMEIVA